MGDTEKPGDKAKPEPKAPDVPPWLPLPDDFKEFLACKRDSVQLGGDEQKTANKDVTVKFTPHPKRKRHFKRNGPPLGSVLRGRFSPVEWQALGRQRRGPNAGLDGHNSKMLVGDDVLLSDDRRSRESLVGTIVDVHERCEEDT